jgi:hypothetical protein
MSANTSSLVVTVHCKSGWPAGVSKRGCSKHSVRIGLWKRGRWQSKL